MCGWECIRGRGIDGVENGAGTAVEGFSGGRNSQEICDSLQSRGSSPGARRSPQRSAGVTRGRTAWRAGCNGDAAKLDWMIVGDAVTRCVDLV